MYKIEKDLRIEYRKILIKKLKNFNEWNKYRFEISKNSQIGLRFETYVPELELDFEIYKNIFSIKNHYTSVNICSFRIGFFDFEIKYLVKKLKYYLNHRDEYTRIEYANETLRKLLGPKFERTQKLKTLNKKSS
jgi:hypothetical protein